MKVNVNELKARKNPSECKHYNTLPVPRLYNFGVTRDGYIWDKKEKKYLDTFYDYRNKEVIVILPANKEMTNFTWYRVKELIVLAFIGIVPNTKVIYNKINDWENPDISILSYEIYQRDEFPDEKRININGIDFRQYRDTYKYFSENSVIYDSYMRKFSTRSERVDPIVAGYIDVSIYGKVVSLHRAVYIAWKGEPPAGYEINHIDHVRWNCKLENLEAISKRDNILDAYKFNHKRALSDEEILKIYEDLKNHVPTKVLAEKYNIGRGSIQAIKNHSSHGDIITDDVKVDTLHKDSPTGVTPDQVEKVCQMIIAGKKSTDIERETGVPYNTIGAIKSGRIFKKISAPYMAQVKTTVTDMGKSLNAQIVEEIAQLLLQGKGPTEIGKIYGVSEGTIMKIKSKKIWNSVVDKYDFSNWNEKKSGSKITADDVHRMCKVILEQKYTSDEIGAMFGVSRTSVNDIIGGRTWTQISKYYDFTSVRENQRKRTAA